MCSTVQKLGSAATLQLVVPRLLHVFVVQVSHSQQGALSSQIFCFSFVQHGQLLVALGCVMCLIYNLGMS